MSAEEVEDIKRCADAHDRKHTTSDDFLCGWDGLPCEVFSVFGGAIIPLVEGPPAPLRVGSCAEVFGITGSRLPCYHCRGMEQQARALSGVRLGRQERRLLLMLPSPDEEEAVIQHEQSTRGCVESTLRAARKLARYGLVWLGSQRVNITTRKYAWHGDYELPAIPVRRDYYVKSATLSPLGFAVVSLLREPLETGKPIRWSRVQDELIRSVRKETAALVDLYWEDIRELPTRMALLSSLTRASGLNKQEANWYSRESEAYGFVKKAMEDLR